MSGTLIAFASALEFSRLFPQIPATSVQNKAVPLSENHVYASVLGVGILAFASNLAFLMSGRHFDRIIQVGIGGAFKNKGLSIGDIVRVDSEIIGDLGVQERDGSFSPWSRIGGGDVVSYEGGSVRDAPELLQRFKGVAGITVNCCTGTSAQADLRSVLFDAAVESMEGAACLAMGRVFRIPAYEIRAISNYVSDRDKSRWKINQALESLKVDLFNKMEAL